MRRVVRKCWEAHHQPSTTREVARTSCMDMAWAHKNLLPWSFNWDKTAMQTCCSRWTPKSISQDSKSNICVLQRLCCFHPCTSTFLLSSLLSSLRCFSLFSILSDYLSGILRGNLCTWSSSVFYEVNYPLMSYLTFSCIYHVCTELKALNPKIIKSKGRILFSIRNHHARLKACDWKAGRIIKELIPRVLHSSGSIPMGASGGRS